MSLEQYEEAKAILAGAPDGATHVDNNGFYLMAAKSGFMDLCDDGRDWDYDYANHCHVNALSDIKTLCAQYERIAELENALATSFEFLSLSRPLDNLFYENHKHLIEEQGE